jgi:hypothetical protein
VVSVIAIVTGGLAVYLVVGLLAYWLLLHHRPTNTR